MPPQGLFVTPSSPALSPPIKITTMKLPIPIAKTNISLLHSHGRVYSHLLWADDLILEFRRGGALSLIPHRKIWRSRNMYIFTNPDNSCIYFCKKPENMFSSAFCQVPALHPTKTAFNFAPTELLKKHHLGACSLLVCINLLSSFQWEH